MHEIATAIGPEMAKGLPFFHAFSGCDTTSSFANNGKKSAWNTWRAWPEITECFAFLSSPVSPILPENIMEKLERFVVLLYCRTNDVNVDKNDTFPECQGPLITFHLQRQSLRSTQGDQYIKPDISGDNALNSCQQFPDRLTGAGTPIRTISGLSGQFHLLQGKLASS